MKKSQLVEAIKSVLAEGMPNFKNPTKFETQNDTPEMTKVRKKLHAIQDRLDQYDADVKAGKMKDPDKRKAVKNKITDDQQAIFAELQKLAKEAKDKKKQKLDENRIRQAVKEVLAEADQHMKIGGRFHAVKVDEEGNKFIELFNGPKIYVQRAGQEQRSLEDIEQEIGSSTKTSSGSTSMGHAADVAKALRYGSTQRKEKGYKTFGNLGQTPREFRPSDEPNR